MISTVVGSFPAEIKSPTTAKDKILNVFGAYDPFKESIKQTVISQLDAGVDIISDGQVRGDMVSTLLILFLECSWKTIILLSLLKSDSLQKKFPLMI